MLLVVDVRLIGSQQEEEQWCACSCCRWGPAGGRAQSIDRQTKSRGQRMRTRARARARDVLAVPVVPEKN
jgi:hypothetical protein